MQDTILSTLKNPALWDRVQADLYDDLEVASDSGQSFKALKKVYLDEMYSVSQ